MKVKVVYKNFKKPIKALDPKTIHVTVAKELDQEVLTKIKEKFGEDCDIKVKVDPAVLGGIAIRKGDKLFDGTIKSQLRELELNLKNN